MSVSVSAPARGDPRLAAARALDRVLAGQTLDAALPAALATVAVRDRGLVSECCYGTLRHHASLSWLLERLLRRPLKRRETLVRMLLLVGLYQCWELRVPDHAAVSATVDAARQLGKPWAVSLVNAVLRAFLRQRETLLKALAAEPLASTEHPRWLAARFREDWPAQWQALIAANNSHPPMVLRVNQRRIDTAAYLRELTAVDIAARPVAGSDTALQLERPRDVETLPGFAEGLVSVQDAGAQLAADWLAPTPGQRVLDACAAPGGKTCHLLERYDPAELVALDIDPGRLARVADNLRRLGLRASLVAGDLRRPRDWWDGRLFQRILLDAPCSGTGVIRRHPDIKLLRRAADITPLAAHQLQLLEQAWTLLAPGGYLLYVTCSVLREENVTVMSRFLAHTDAVELPLSQTWGLSQAVGRQLLPGPDGTDGFYYACIVKPH